MKGEQVLLTISIPTFNGARFLEETIRSAWREVQFFDNVSILVVDNASTDETFKICERLRSEGVNFKYVAQKETVPADLNHLSAVSLSDSEYVWILADDDVLTRGSVGKICIQLIEHRPVVAVINFENIDEKGGVVTGGALHRLDHTSGRLGEEQFSTEVWEKGGDAFVEIGLEKIGVLSANCVLREAYLAEYSGPAHRVPEGGLFMYLVAATMLSGRTLYFPERLVHFRTYAKRWEATELSDPLKIDYVITPGILKSLGSRGYKDKAMRRIISERATTLTWHIAQAKAKGQRLSLALARKIISANFPNLLIPLQMVLWFFPAKVSKYLAAFYTSRLANFARKLSMKQIGKR